MTFRRHPALGALAALLALSCGGPARVQGPRAISNDQRAQLLELGNVHAAADTVTAELARLRAIAEASATIGNTTEAMDALQAMVDVAHLNAATARATGRDDTAAADAHLRDTQIFAATTARELSSPYFLLNMAAHDHTGGAIDEHLLWAARHASNVWSEDIYEALFQLAKGDIELQAQLEGRRSFEGGFELPIDQLVTAGTTAVPALISRLDDALEKGDRDEVAQVAAAIAKVDPWATRARMAALYLADVDAGRVVHSARLMSDVAGTTPPLAAFTRLERAVETNPDATSLSLGLARRYVHAELESDAAIVLRRLRVAGGLDAAATELVGDLEAIIDLDAGDLSAYRAWRTKRGAAASVTVTAWESRYHGDLSPPAARLFAAESMRQAFADGIPTLGYPNDGARAFVVASDRDTPRAVRERAAELLRTWYRNEAILAEHCIERDLPTARCRELQRHNAALEDGEWYGDDLVEALAGQLDMGMPATLLEAVIWMSAEDMRRTAPHIDRLAGTRYEVTPQYAYARVMIDIASGDADLAKTRMATLGALMSPISRAAYELVIDDLASGRAEADDLVVSILWPGLPLDVGDAAPDAYADRIAARTGTTHTDALARALMYAWRGDAAVAAKELAPLVAAIDSDALSALAARTAVAAGDIAAAEQLAATVREGSPMRAYVDGHLAVAAGAHTDAAAKLGASLTLTMYSRADEELFMRAVAAANPGAPGAERLAGYTETISHEHWWLTEALAREQVTTGAQITGHFDADDDRTKAMGLTGTRVGWAAAEGYLAYSELIGNAATAKDARTLGREALAFIDDSTTDWRYSRFARAWLYFLTGLGDKALEVATGPERDGDPPFDSWSAIVLLSSERGKTITGDLAWRLWKFYVLEIGDAATVAQAVLDSVPRGATGARVACRLLVDANLSDQAIEPCFTAWRVATDDSDLAAAVTWLLLNRPAEVMSLGILPEKLYADASALLRNVTDDGVWLRNLAIYFENQGDHARAAEATVEAYARDYIEEDGYSPTWDLYYAQIEAQPTQMRHIANESYNGSGAAKRAWLGILAMASGDVDVAAHYFASVSPRSFGDDELTMAQLYGRVGGGASLIRDDLAAGRSTGDGGARWWVGNMDTIRPEAAEAFAADNPGSQLAELVRVEAYGPREPAKAIDIARGLVERHPDNPAALVTLIYLLDKNGSSDEARDVYARAAEIHPNSAYVASVEPAPAADTAAGTAAWARNLDSYNEHLAAVTVAQLEALEPGFAGDATHAADAAFPGTYTAHPSLDLGYVSPDSTFTGIVTEPRAAMCEGAACMDAMIGQFEARGRELVWRQPIDLPSGAGGEALFVGDDNTLISMAVIPVGGRLFALMYGGPAAAYESHIADWVLLRQSFRPADLVIPADRAQQLRAQRYVDGTVRLAARRQLASAPATGCPIAPALAALEDDDSRGALLLDVVLGGRADQVRRLLDCAKPDEPAAARLAAIAVLHEDPTVHAYGRDAARAFPDQALADGRVALVPTEHSTVSARSRQALGGEAPSYGWLELLGALPDDHRKAAADDLFRSVDSNERAVAILAAGMYPNTIDAELIRGEIRNAPARWATLAVAGIDAPTDDDLDAMRKRLDDLTAPLDHDGRELAAALAYALARRVDPADEARLRLAVSVVSRDVSVTDHKHAVRIGDRIEYYANVYDRARALEKARAKGAKNDDESALAWSWLSAKRQRTATASVISTEKLATLSLERLLDGEAWSFARLAQPGLFAASAEGMYERLQAGAATDTFMARRMITAAIANVGADILGEVGGLDLSRPLECASPGNIGTAGFVCSASVRDADAVRRVLAARSPGSNSGFALPMQIALNGTYVPLAAGFAPGLLHTMLFGERTIGDAPASLIAMERARASRVIAGHTLERYITASATDTEGASASAEYALFVGDRVLVFSSRELAQRVLSDLPAARASLAGSAEFERLTANWPAGGSLQAIALGGSSALAATGHVAFEVVLDSSGAVMRMNTPGGKRQVGVAGARSLLPDNAIATLASSMDLDTALDAVDDLAIARTDESGTPPPVWLLEGDAPIAFGWYLPTGFELWERWVIVLEHGKRTKKVLETHSITGLAAGTVNEHDGLHYGLNGGYLVVASAADLAEDAVSRTPAKAKRGPVETMSGSLDGIELARALRMIARGFRSADDRANLLTIFAKIVGAAETITVSSTIDTRAKRDRIEGRVSPNLADEGVDLALVDQWLASPGIRNATKLPAPLEDDQLGGPVVFVLEVDDAKDTAERLFAGVPRSNVEIISDTRLRLTIDPGPKLDESTSASALSDDERARLLASTAGIRASDPKIKKIVQELVPAGTDPKDAARLINEWVHSHVAYEITPESLDAVQVLELARGDCTEYSQLTVALLRAAGIPAEHRQGMAIGFGEMVAHNWVAFHDGTGWREIDPTWGRTWVDAGHMETSVTEFISLISLDQLAIISAKPSK